MSAITYRTVPAVHVLLRIRPAARPPARSPHARLLLLSLLAAHIRPATPHIHPTPAPAPIHQPTVQILRATPRTISPAALRRRAVATPVLTLLAALITPAASHIAPPAPNTINCPAVHVPQRIRSTTTPPARHPHARPLLLPLLAAHIRPAASQILPRPAPSPVLRRYRATWIRITPTQIIVIAYPRLVVIRARLLARHR